MIKELIASLLIYFIHKHPEQVDELLEFITSRVGVLNTRALLSAIKEIEYQEYDIRYKDKVNELHKALLMEYRKRSGILPS